MSTISTLDQLREYFPQPKGRSLHKQRSALEQHSRRFISLSPFVTIASSAQEGADASPRGGDPGFVHVLDDTTLLIPDSPGNNRLDTLQNIISQPNVGLLFLIPGINETLRINGRARLTCDDNLLQLFQQQKHLPKLLIEVAIEDVYLHCAKSLMRAKLWQPEAQSEIRELPSMGVMIRDQLGEKGEVESQQDMVKRYQQNLY